jgi:NitT/TauT family transport system substrate-binding protein
MRFWLGLLTAAWVVTAAAAGEAVPLRVALVRAPSAAPLYIAMAAGYFRAEGLDPRISFLGSEASVSAAVASGSADIGLSSLSARFYRYAAAHRLKMIASAASEHSGFPMFALLIGAKASEAGVSGVRQLPGRRIGIAETEQGAYYGLFAAVSRFGLDPGRIGVVWSKSPALELAALSRGDIDAALLPFATAIQSAGKGSRVVPLSDLTVWQEGVVFTAGETIATRRALIERFMRAYQRGTSEYQLNFLSYDDAGDFIPGPAHDEYLPVIAAQARVSAGLLQKTKTYCDRRANLDVADIRKQVKFWQGRGELDPSVQPDDLLDLSFIKEESVGAVK